MPSLRSNTDSRKTGSDREKGNSVIDASIVDRILEQLLLRLELWTSSHRIFSETTQFLQAGRDCFKPFKEARSPQLLPARAGHQDRLPLTSPPAASCPIPGWGATTPAWGTRGSANREKKWHQWGRDRGQRS